MEEVKGRRKGISRRSLPYVRAVPQWFKGTAAETEKSICQLAKKGLRPSQIGVTLRDSHGVAQVKKLNGTSILRILKRNGLAPAIPEDLYFMIRKAMNMRKHLESNHGDKDSKFRLILVESRIYRLARYYKRNRQLPPNWKYQAANASALVA